MSADHVVAPCVGLARHFVAHHHRIGRTHPRRRSLPRMRQRRPLPSCRTSYQLPVAAHHCGCESFLSIGYPFCPPAGEPARRPIPEKGKWIRTAHGRACSFSTARSFAAATRRVILIERIEGREEARSTRAGTSTPIRQCPAACRESAPREVKDLAHHPAGDRHDEDHDDERPRRIRPRRTRSSSSRSHPPTCAPKRAAIQMPPRYLQASISARRSLGAIRSRRPAPARGRRLNQVCSIQPVKLSP